MDTLVISNVNMFNEADITQVAKDNNFNLFVNKVDDETFNIFLHGDYELSGNYFAMLAELLNAGLTLSIEHN